MEEFVITIDGPAGSGKTTVAKALAKKLNLSLLESGALYRAITYALKQRGIQIENLPTDNYLRSKIEEILSKIDVRLTPDGTEIIFEGRLLQGELRAKEVEAIVSEVSAQPLIREAITNFLRQIVKGKKVITEGRDMGSVVFPKAKIKFFLTADLLERARRRAKDFPERTLEEIKENLIFRDKKDSEREVAPLVIPKGAIVIDTTKLSLEEVIEKISSIIKRKRYA